METERLFKYDECNQLSQKPEYPTSTTRHRPAGSLCLCPQNYEGSLFKAHYPRKNKNRLITLMYATFIIMTKCQKMLARCSLYIRG